MVAMNTPVCDFGIPAIDFSLPDPKGQIWSLADCQGPKGTLVMFICNHCPYVMSILDDLLATIKKIEDKGVKTVAIMSNDWTAYPADSPDKMLELQQQYNITFPYLIDETQEVAKSYGAVCTPDFFGYNSSLELHYRGRFDARGRDHSALAGSNELEYAMLEIAKTGKGPKIQNPSIGCSIKWRE